MYSSFSLLYTKKKKTKRFLLLLTSSHEISCITKCPNVFFIEFIPHPTCVFFFSCFLFFLRPGGGWGGVGFILHIFYVVILHTYIYTHTVDWSMWIVTCDDGHIFLPQGIGSTRTAMNLSCSCGPMTEAKNEHQHTSD